MTLESVYSMWYNCTCNECKVKFDLAFNRTEDPPCIQRAAILDDAILIFGEATLLVELRRNG